MADSRLRNKKRTILVAVDTSQHSTRAFNCKNKLHFVCAGYAEQLHQENDLLLIIHVVQPPQTVAIPMDAGAVVDALQHEWRQVEARAESLLNRFDKKCRDQKFNFELLKDTGQPGDVICKVAQQRSVDLIIVGSRGQGQVRRTFLGSISDYVVHHANIPVGVVPPPLKHDAQ